MKTVLDVIRQPLVIGALVLSILIVVGVYFGSHWYYGDIEPVPEHLLTLEPSPPSVNQDTSITNYQDTESLEWESASEVEEFSDDEVTTVLDEIDDELASLLVDEAPLSSETGDFPEVPDGFPSDLIPVWIQFPDYEKGDMYEHEMMYRVLIKLWNQGDHNFVNGVYKDDNGRVYPLYTDVVYLEWGEAVNEHGQVIRFPRSTIATHAREPGAKGGLFTNEELLSGAYKTKYPGLKLIEYTDAGYDPETFLDDY